MWLFCLSLAYPSPDVHVRPRCTPFLKIVFLCLTKRGLVQKRAKVIHKSIRETFLSSLKAYGTVARTSGGEGHSAPLYHSFRTTPSSVLKFGRPDHMWVLRFKMAILSLIRLHCTRCARAPRMHPFPGGCFPVPYEVWIDAETGKSHTQEHA